MFQLLPLGIVTNPYPKGSKWEELNDWDKIKAQYPNVKVRSKKTSKGTVRLAILGRGKVIPISFLRKNPELTEYDIKLLQSITIGVHYPLANYENLEDNGLVVRFTDGRYGLTRLGNQELIDHTIESPKLEQFDLDKGGEYTPNREISLQRHEVTMPSLNNPPRMSYEEISKRILDAENDARDKNAAASTAYQDYLMEGGTKALAARFRKLEDIAYRANMKLDRLEDLRMSRDYSNPKSSTQVIIFSILALIGLKFLGR